MRVEPEDSDGIGTESGERAEAAVAVTRQNDGVAPSADRLPNPLGQDAVQLERGADFRGELVVHAHRLHRDVVTDIGE